MSWHDVVGSIGAALIVFAYWRLQTARFHRDSLTYLVLNGGGAALILVSLTVEFNLSAFVIESFWVAISLFGIARVLRARHSPAAESSTHHDRSA
ncbi:MAG: hypothetical protein AAGC60_14955 [Acidobacteriota bacterium]